MRFDEKENRLIDHTKWIGKKVVSQYGLVCEVLDAQVEKDTVMITCLDQKGKKWTWDLYHVSLVTKEGEILDPEEGIIFGKVVDNNWDLYDDDQCRKIPLEEVEKEFS